MVDSEESDSRKTRDQLRRVSIKLFGSARKVLLETHGFHEEGRRNGGIVHRERHHKNENEKLGNTA